MSCDELLYLHLFYRSTILKRKNSFIFSYNFYLKKKKKTKMKEKSEINTYYLKKLMSFNIYNYN